MHLHQSIKNRLASIVFMIIGLGLSGCAANPFKMDGVNRLIQPQQTLSDRETLNKKVIWGGLIVATRNFKDHSLIEVLSYPLHENGEPRRTAQAQGRFLMKIKGFIEPAEYASGRWISAVGTVTAGEKGQIGQAEYTYPVLQVEERHVWPEEGSDSDIKTRFHFGIGIRI